MKLLILSSYRKVWLLGAWAYIFGETLLNLPYLLSTCAYSLTYKMFDIDARNE